MFAARVGDLASAKLLVAAGANVERRGCLGRQRRRRWPRTRAFAIWSSSCSTKAPTRTPAAAGFTALHAAIMRRDEKMVRALLAHGADPNAPLRRRGRRRAGRRATSISSPSWSARRRSGWRPASRSRTSCACSSSTAPIRCSCTTATRIVDGKDGRAYDHRTEATTALMAAIGMGGGGTAWVQPDRAEREALMLETVKLAVELGVDVNAANTDGRTALDAAKALKFETVVTYLVSKGAKPGKTDKKEEPAGR